MISIAFSGPAGGGVNTAGLILASYLTNLGYLVYGDREYQSIIKGGNNTFIVYFDLEKLYLTKKIDFFIYYDDFALVKNKIYDIQQKIKVPQVDGLFQNIVSVGIAFKILQVDEKTAIEHIKNYFSYKKLPDEILEKNILSVKEGYKVDIKNASITLDKSNRKVNFSDGNKVIADGALKAGLEFYSAYPMTPASSLIKYLAGKTTFFQGEDEIAVAMAMLGARFAGKRSMCGTSGGGFALMSESISFANQAEIGGVYILSQRSGPSTGTPTFVEQGDILFACNSSFGDTKPIVIYPNTFENAYKLIQYALIWGEVYQHPIIVLLDKQFSESYMTYISQDFEIPDRLKQFSEKILLQNNVEGLKRYEITESGISKYTIPGVQNGEFIATSYEHNETGFSIEDPDIKKSMTDKRFKKLEFFKKNEFNNKYYGYDIINENASKFIVTVGINHLVCNEFVKRYPDWGLITVKNLQPLDSRFKKYLENADKIVFVELNKSGQLQEIILTGLDLKCKSFEEKVSYVRKYNNYPLFIEDLEEGILKS